MAENISLSETDLSLFSGVLASFHTLSSMEDILSTTLEKIRPIFHIEGASIALHDDVHKEFYFYRTIEDGITQDKQEDSPPPLRFPDSKGIAGWVMTNNASVLIDDVHTDSRVFTLNDSADGFSTKSMICVPLRTRKNFIGVLYALNKLSGPFTDRDRKLLEILSSTIAVSLENARLYGELKSHIHSLEREKRILLSRSSNHGGFDKIIGSSGPMRQLFELMQKVIDTPTTVLIEGETGTGKELIARVIHANGPLKHRPFVAENCAALPENLLESELFGHVRGAFTGALTDKKGLFEIADGGTIFLDEIGEMSLQMQVKLLRVLQEGQIRPVGSSRIKAVEVRVIASTNRNLEEEVANGTFREDLFYRINVFQIIPPPLRDRGDDIYQLAQTFLTQQAKKLKRTVPRIMPGTVDLLMRYPWPGNVRQLENEMERAIAMVGPDNIITPELLSDKIKHYFSPYLLEPWDGSSGTLKEVVRTVESRMIRDTLERFQGNRTRTAKSLGLSRQGLLNKIAAYSITDR